MNRAGSIAWRALLGLLLALGIFASVERARSVASDDPAALDRKQLEAVAHIAGLTPGSGEYARLEREIPRSVANLNGHPRATLWHVMAGAAFFVFVPIQFSRRIRARHPGVHRWNGRAMLTLSTAATFGAIYLGLAQPYGGAVESAGAVVFACWLLMCAARGYFAIRRRQVARHREWMIRMFAVAIGISVIRALGMVNLLVFGTEIMNPAGFALSLWLGFVLSCAVGELWIIRTRTRRPAESEAALQPL